MSQNEFINQRKPLYPYNKFEIKKAFKKRYKKKRHVSGPERGPTEGVPFLEAKDFSNF